MGKITSDSSLRDEVEGATRVQAVPGYHLITADFSLVFIRITISDTVGFTINAALTSGSAEDTFAVVFKNGERSNGRKTNVLDGETFLEGISLGLYVELT